MAVPMRKDDPAYWMLKDGHTSIPVPGVYRSNCYICTDPEFAQMGLPLCKPCPECQRKNGKVEWLVDVWKCKLHANCWSNSHLALETIAEMAKACDVTCKCWKHTILAYMKNGPKVGHVPADDEVCTDCGYQIVPEDYGHVYNETKQKYEHPLDEVTESAVAAKQSTSLQDLQDKLKAQIISDHEEIRMEG